MKKNSSSDSDILYSKTSGDIRYMKFKKPLFTQNFHVVRLKNNVCSKEKRLSGKGN